MKEHIQKLKAAIKQLVEETRAVKQDKARLKAEKPSDYEGKHGVLQTRREACRIRARALYLAYGYARGVHYQAIEGKVTPVGKWGRMDLIYRVSQALGENPPTSEVLKAWFEATPASPVKVTEVAA